MAEKSQPKKEAKKKAKTTIFEKRALKKAKKAEKERS